MANFVIRSPGSAREPLQFDWAGGVLSVNAVAQPLRILRRDAAGGIVALWGEQVVSGVLTRDIDRGHKLLLNIGGGIFELTVRAAMLDAMEQGIAKTAANGGHLELTSPIPGLVKNVLVKPGEKVTAGQNLIVLEAMKMENEIAAVHDGTVESIEVKPGQAVAAGALLAVLKTS
jgi:acetyl/propionyl-CoA carboxylase alpha subunit